MAAESAHAPAQHAHRNEDFVLAESALRGERQVSVLRLALMALRGVSIPISVAITGGEPAPSPLRGVAIGLYWVFAIGTYVYLRRARPAPGTLKLAPYFFTSVDVLFMVTMAWVPETFDHEPYMAALHLAAVLGYSSVRVNVRQVYFSAALTMLGYAIITLRVAALSGEQVNWVFFSFVLVTYASLALLLRGITFQVHEMFVGLRRRDALSRFLPAPIVERVLKQDLVALSPMKREVTVLFSDLRDFTRLSESMDPGAVLELLDLYHAELSRIVKDHGGIVNKFMGDGMLCFWNVPQLVEGHADKAVQAALAIRAKLVELNDRRRAANLPELRIGIGIHTGVVAAGVLGGIEQCEYTVVGDAVNLASRIEGLTKRYATDLLVSETTWNQLSGRYEGVRRAEESIRGRAEKVTVYDLKEAAVPARSAAAR